MPHNKHLGEKYEFLISDMLNAAGLNAIPMGDTETDSYYDIICNNKLIEIKSAKLVKSNGSIHNSHKNQLAAFAFKNKKNLQLLQENKGYIVFIVYYGEQHIIIGALEAEKLNPRKERHALSVILREKPTPIEEFIKILK